MNKKTYLQYANPSTLDNLSEKLLLWQDRIKSIENNNNLPEVTKKQLLDSTKKEYQKYLDLCVLASSIR